MKNISVVTKYLSKNILTVWLLILSALLSACNFGADTNNNSSSPSVNSDVISNKNYSYSQLNQLSSGILAKRSGDGVTLRAYISLRASWLEINARDIEAIVGETSVIKIEFENKANDKFSIQRAAWTQASGWGKIANTCQDGKVLNAGEKCNVIFNYQPSAYTPKSIFEFKLSGSYIDDSGLDAGYFENIQIIYSAKLPISLDNTIKSAQLKSSVIKDGTNIGTITDNSDGSGKIDFELPLYFDFSSAITLELTVPDGATLKGIPHTSNEQVKSITIKPKVKRFSFTVVSGAGTEKKYTVEINLTRFDLKMSMLYLCGTKVIVWNPINKIAIAPDCNNEKLKNIAINLVIAEKPDPRMKITCSDALICKVISPNGATQVLSLYRIIDPLKMEVVWSKLQQGGISLLIPGVDDNTMNVTITNYFADEGVEFETSMLSVSMSSFLEIVYPKLDGYQSCSNGLILQKGESCIFKVKAKFTDKNFNGEGVLKGSVELSYGYMNYPFKTVVEFYHKVMSKKSTDNVIQSPKLIDADNRQIINGVVNGDKIVFNPVAWDFDLINGAKLTFNLPAKASIVDVQSNLSVDGAAITGIRSPNSFSFAVISEAGTKKQYIVQILGEQVNIIGWNFKFCDKEVINQQGGINIPFNCPMDNLQAKINPDKANAGQKKSIISCSNGKCTVTAPNGTTGSFTLIRDVDPNLYNKVEIKLSDSSKNNLTIAANNIATDSLTYTLKNNTGYVIDIQKVDLIDAGNPDRAENISGLSIEKQSNQYWCGHDNRLGGGLSCQIRVKYGPVDVATKRDKLSVKAYYKVAEYSKMISAVDTFSIDNIKGPFAMKIVYNRYTNDGKPFIDPSQDDGKIDVTITNNSASEGVKFNRSQLTISDSTALKIEYPKGSGNEQCNDDIIYLGQSCRFKVSANFGPASLVKDGSVKLTYNYKNQTFVSQVDFRYRSGQPKFPDIIEKSDVIGHVRCGNSWSDPTGFGYADQMKFINERMDPRFKYLFCYKKNQPTDYVGSVGINGYGYDVNWRASPMWKTHQYLIKGEVGNVNFTFMEKCRNGSPDVSHDWTNSGSFKLIPVGMVIDHYQETSNMDCNSLIKG